METLENDVNHIMGRGETSDVSGIPTLSRLLTDIDEVKFIETLLSLSKTENYQSTCPRRDALDDYR